MSTAGTSGAPYPARQALSPGISAPDPGIFRGAGLARIAETAPVTNRPDSPQLPDAAASGQSAEELCLWADYYEAATQALEIVRAGGITQIALSQITAHSARATAALKRIRELRGYTDP